jgi:hypothetical protein
MHHERHLPRLVARSAERRVPPSIGDFVARDQRTRRATARRRQRRDGDINIVTGVAWK